MPMLLPCHRYSEPVGSSHVFAVPLPFGVPLLPVASHHPYPDNIKELIIPMMNYA